MDLKEHTKVHAVDSNAANQSTTVITYCSPKAQNRPLVPNTKTEQKLVYAINTASRYNRQQPDPIHNYCITCQKTLWIVLQVITVLTMNND